MLGQPLKMDLPLQKFKIGLFNVFFQNFFSLIRVAAAAWKFQESSFQLLFLFHFFLLQHFAHLQNVYFFFSPPNFISAYLVVVLHMATIEKATYALTFYALLSFF